jgi:hypothetical protein
LGNQLTADLSFAAATIRIATIAVGLVFLKALIEDGFGLLEAKLVNLRLPPDLHCHYRVNFKLQQHFEGVR